MAVYRTANHEGKKPHIFTICIKQEEKKEGNFRLLFR